MSAWNKPTKKEVLIFLHSNWIGKRLLNEETNINYGNNYYSYSMSGGIRDIHLFFVQPNTIIISI